MLYMSLTTFKKKSVIQYGSKRSGSAPGGVWLPQGPFGHATIALQKALQAKHRIFGNLSFETHIKEKGQQWKFDVTYNWLGEQRLPNTTSNPVGYQLADYAPSFAVMNTQITRTFSSTFELYVGGENIGNYKQNNGIVQSENPFGTYFDSSMLYGPVFGQMYYAGLRFKIK